MIYLGILAQATPDINIPLPSETMATALLSVVLLALIGGCSYLIKRSLDTLKEIEGRVNRHDTVISLHDIRIGSIEERMKA